ncbi:MAG TPA: hypothetical protein VHG89_11475 [Verrucomicrobiae bacterium]|nr:hypothetical protein [Verrucomicrobiae bacterium]
MKRKLVIIFSSVILFLTFWFLCVDGIIFVESCPDCMYGRDVFKIRIFTIPIYQHTIDEHTSITQRIAMDLGAECKHPNLSGYEKWRFWGFLIPQEVHPGIDWMTGDDWYDDKARAIVKEMVKTNPSLRDEFANRVLKNHDWKYLKAFVQKVIALEDGKPVPAPQE